LSDAIAEKVLFRSAIEIDAAEAEVLALALVLAEVDVAGVLLLLLLLLLQAARSRAAAAAAAVSPALADTEYNGVPRLFSRDMPIGHVRDLVRVSPVSTRPGASRGIVGLLGETFQLTLS
jgi:hypothetical protein